MLAQCPLTHSSLLPPLQVATPAQRWLCTTPPPSVVAAVLGCHAARDMSSSELARCLCEALVLGTAAEEA